jgi:hypothetical protein
MRSFWEAVLGVAAIFCACAFVVWLAMQCAKTVSAANDNDSMSVYPVPPDSVNWKRSIQEFSEGQWNGLAVGLKNSAYLQKLQYDSVNGIRWSPIGARIIWDKSKMEKDSANGLSMWDMWTILKEHGGKQLKKWAK